MFGTSKDKGGGFSAFKRYAVNVTKLVVAAEVGAFLITYGAYVKTNRDPEFRYKLLTGQYAQTGQLWLDGYYRLGELMDSSLQQRKHDIEYWRSTGKDV